FRVSSSGGRAQDAGGETPSKSVEWDPEEGGERPAPPEGWYEPYVPEEKPVDGPQPKPRGDAW
ncbi:hypothetical protein, partial [Actinomadura sp. 7K534]|uniref:hypothetical protein n=1 Tax=Actinomadura sp. 7K534 TaxID=2530366 RepID=UPI001A9E5194